MFQRFRIKRNIDSALLSRYGLSEGTPSEQGIRSDAQLALDYIKSHPILERTKVVLYGQSIGGAVSVDLVANNPDRIAGVILENTFLNLVSDSEATLISIRDLRSLLTGKNRACDNVNFHTLCLSWPP